MKSKLLGILALVLLLSLVLAATAFAFDPCPPPPPCAAECSPGFWKNHTEIWQADFSADFDSMMADLKARGPGSAALRYAVADTLNASYPDAPCD